MDYIVNTHIINHYDNTLPNIALFFVVGLCIDSDHRVHTAMSLSIASILFGQPMFIALIIWLIYEGFKKI